MCIRDSSEIGEASVQLGSMVDSALLEPFLERVQHVPAGCWVDFQGFEDQPLFFWKQALKVMVHSMRVGQVGDKAIGQLIERLQSAGKRDGWIPLRKESRSLVQDGRLLFFRPAFFPFAIERAEGSRSSGPVFKLHIPEGAELLVGSVASFGPWTVSLERVADGFGPAEVERAPLKTVEVLSGEFSYTVPAGGAYKIRRSKPPKMFRQLERAIVEQLPVVQVEDPIQNCPEGQRIRVHCRFDDSVPTDATRAEAADLEPGETGASAELGV
eukprot:TRINITY_DN45105_c0_g1_i1.p1 TRINITY_DN45105_c0_g1~~TRINITY_DN45105_c0_g1_i1.p1  ORF type:complete len:270 (+),score=64.14 TRINITY_DN45105_c0_g1_i1:159-968(+)